MQTTKRIQLLAIEMTPVDGQKHWGKDEFDAVALSNSGASVEQSN
jgi:hypothetical protein